MGCEILRLGPLIARLKAGEKKKEGPWILARGKKVRT